MNRLSQIPIHPQSDQYCYLVNPISILSIILRPSLNEITITNNYYMKKQILAFAIGLLSFNLTAQINKGTYMLGGEVSYSGTHIDNEYSTSGQLINGGYKSNNLAIRPQIGEMITNSLMLGIGLNYELNTLKISTISSTTDFRREESSKMILINPYLKKFRAITKKFYFTTTFNFLAGIGKGKYANAYNSYFETELKEFRINITPGLTYFLSDKWAISGSFGRAYYNYQSEKPSESISIFKEPNNVTQNYGLDFSLQSLNIGFHLFIKDKEQ